MVVTNRSRVFAFYSYKGGTGRTTASANVAALLAKQGHRVLCIDLDLEGPGVAIVFNIAESKPFALPGYFDGDEINRSDFIEYDNTSTSSDSGLWILPASNRSPGSLDTSRGGSLVAQVRRLIDLAENELAINIVIIDTPSGFGDLSALSMYVSDCVVALFRYSRQHVFGTAKVADFVRKNQLKFLPVASCVPPKDYDGERQRYKEMLATFYSEPVIEIKEDDSLKWRERVLVNSNTPSPALNGYELLAAKLMEML